MEAGVGAEGVPHYPRRHEGHEAAEPNDPDPFEELGRFFQENGQLTEAFDASAKSVQLFSELSGDYWEDCQAVHRLFDITIATGRLDDFAHHFLIQFLIQNNFFEEHWPYHAVLLLLQGKKHEAGAATAKLILKFVQFEHGQVFYEIPMEFLQAHMAWEEGKFTDAAVFLLDQIGNYRGLSYLPYRLEGSTGYVLQAEHPVYSEDPKPNLSSRRRLNLPEETPGQAFDDLKDELYDWVTHFEICFNQRRPDLGGEWATRQRQQKDHLREVQRLCLEAIPGWTWDTSPPPRD